MASMSSLLDRSGPVPPSDEEIRLAEEASRRLLLLLRDRDRLTIRVTVGDGPDESLVLPASVVRLLSEILAQMARGNAVTVVPVPSELTIYQAADLLNVSRPYVVGLLDRGEIPYREEGSDRRITLRDLVDYKRRDYAERRKILDEIAQLSQEMGLY
jgi:excisionase family DNA binding protein